MPKKSKISKAPVVLITASGRGLGAYLAHSFSKKGYRILLHYRTKEDEVLKLAKKINAEAVFQADLASESNTKWVADEIKSTFGSLDCLVNNAGTYAGKSLMTLSEAEWFEGIDSTASATYFTTKALLPLLRKSSCPRVINIGDSSCDRPTARDLAVSYHIGKTGVHILTKSFAQSEAKHGVTVNMVSPGWMENSVGKLSKSSIPAGRYGRFEDIWNAIEFLIQPESDYVNGSNLIVSGGWNLR
jgi:3-oxoacyl-[acyl-carrier protein] reductase